MVGASGNGRHAEARSVFVAGKFVVKPPRGKYTLLDLEAAGKTMLDS